MNHGPKPLISRKETCMIPDSIIASHLSNVERYILDGIGLTKVRRIDQFFDLLNNNETDMFEVFCDNKELEELQTNKNKELLNRFIVKICSSYITFNIRYIIETELREDLTATGFGSTNCPSSYKLEQSPA
jgi:hypothetical protein